MPTTLEEQIANYREARAIVVDSLAELDNKIELLTKAKRLLETDVTLAISHFSGQDHPNKFVPTQAQVVTIGFPDVDTSSIAGCDSIPEAMEAWAEANNDEVKGKILGAALRKIGLSTAKDDNSVAASIHNIATKSHAQKWQKIGPGHFRLRRELPEAEVSQDLNSDVPDLGIQPDTDPLTDH